MQKCVCLFIYFITQIISFGLFVFSLVLKKCFFTSQIEDEPNEINELDNINESSDLVASQRAIENGVHSKENGENAVMTNGKENGCTENGNRTDDDTASDSGASQRSEVVDYTKSTEYKELIKEIRKNLVCATRLQLKNLSALVRRVAVLLLEFLGTTTLDIDDVLESYVCSTHSNYLF